MAAGEARVTDRHVRAVGSELLHEGEFTRATRLFLDSGDSLICKEWLGPEADDQRRHELSALERLIGVAGVAQLAAPRPKSGPILLEDPHGRLLADAAMPLASAELTDLALDLARVVAAVHQHGVMHPDLSPATIMVSGLRTTLIDFTSATTSCEVWHEFTHHARIVGALPYLAPEQTGRTGRPVDHRADLYALGATLYELATGAPPFGTGDPLRLSHDHLARIPTPPAQTNPQVPAVLSDIIMHLLEKEPDRRYRSADGLVHDLTRLREGRQLRVGEHDFSPALLPPSRLVGRDGQVATLDAAFTQSLSGERRGVLVAGGQGVGKTALVDQLRPIAMAAGGWFVAGKFDQYQQTATGNAAWQAFRALGRLLLAEPERELVELREHLQRTLGRDAVASMAVLPEFATLLQLDPQPEPADPVVVQDRMRWAWVGVLRAVASRKRPVIFVLDDLQWAGSALTLVDAILSQDAVDGLLLVGVYSDDEPDRHHPLSSMVSRWQQQRPGWEYLHLTDLCPPDAAGMVAGMLHMGVSQVSDLADAVVAISRGNPYDTVELLHALQREEVLFPAGGGWRWDTAALHQLGHAHVSNLLAARISALPRPTQSVLEVMACLGDSVEVELLLAGAGDPGAAEQALAVALDDRLVVLQPGGRESVRFRHDRVRDAILRRLGEPRKRALRLRLARRLARQPDLFAAAARQYLPVVDAVRTPAERTRVVALFRRAAERAMQLFDYAAADSYLTALLALVDPADTATLIEVQTGRHAARYSLGQLDQADDIYRHICQLPATWTQRMDATLVQMSSLTNRNRPREAVGLGVDLLRQVGCQVPMPDDLDAEIERGTPLLYRWLGQTNVNDDLKRPEAVDARTHAIGTIITRLLPSTYFGDQPVGAWLALEAVRRWVDSGPAAALIAPASYAAAMIPIGRRGDYRTGRRLLQRLLAVGEARGFKPAVFHSRLMYAWMVGHWSEPIEECVALARRVREEFRQTGDLVKTCHSYAVSIPPLFDCAPSLDDYGDEVESALAFARRTGNDPAAGMFTSHRWLASVLRAQPAAAASQEATEQEAAGAAGSQAAAATLHLTRALAAALLNDPAELERHTAAVTPLLSSICGTYQESTARLLHGLALAGRARTAAPADRDPILATLDRTIEWQAARAADAPANFLHLFQLLEAERAWAGGDLAAAVPAYDRARHEAAGRQRVWHRALIAERAAAFYLALGADHEGHALLEEARRIYQSWGAVAKVDQLDATYPAGAPVRHEPATQPEPRSARRPTAGAHTIDLLGVIAASQVISSETNPGRLRAKAAEVLTNMTGATDVHVLVWQEEDDTWLLSAEDGTLTPLAHEGRRPPVPLSMVRYVKRTLEPLVIPDATRDDRFASDPYLGGLDCCAIMVVPVLSRGRLRKLLLLENRLIRGAFSPEGLDAVKLVVGQLAVSIDNAILYESLERKVAQRTEELSQTNRKLSQANQRLERLSVTDALTGLANRRGFEQTLHAQWQQAQRSRSPIAMAMIDVDHFKRYNDQYGHAAGDRALQRIAGSLRSNVRSADLLARYGGEEFALVMPGADLEAALEIARRLHHAVTSLAIPNPRAADRIITLSIGVAVTTPSRRMPIYHLIELADGELYRAKHAGRNRVSAPTSHDHRST